jgi:uncharacterized LabA/DUF88 family protein
VGWISINSDRCIIGLSEIRGKQGGEQMAEPEAALFLDYENIHIGMQRSFGAIPDVHILVVAIKEHFSKYGQIIIGKAYGDWERFVGVPAALQREQIEPVYIGAKRSFPHDAGLRPGVAKNAADIQLALDAQEMMHERGNINTFILVSGDYDFVPLVIRLHNNSKKVCLSGISTHTSKDLRDLVGDDFVCIDELLGLKALRTPNMPTVDWYALVKYIDQWEKGSMPFIGRKHFANKIPPFIIGKFSTPDGRNMVIGEATAAGIIQVYYVPNPKMEGTQTSAIRLNREHEFVQSVFKVDTSE